MTGRFVGRERGLGAPLTVSFLLHLAIFFSAGYLGLWMAPRLKEAPVYYVDVVSLPVAHPQAGIPAPHREEGQTPALPPPSSPQEMRLPAKTAPRSPLKTPATRPPPKAPATRSREETSREFQQRLTQLEQQADARHQAAAIEALRKLAARGNKGPVGIPGGTGKEAGSDYANYIHSRLTDVFRTVISYQTRNPQVLVRLYISGDGRLLRYRIEQSSGDRLFEDSVITTIMRAEKSFPPPPGKQEFQQSFLFRPQGIGKK